MDDMITLAATIVLAVIGFLLKLGITAVLNVLKEIREEIKALKLTMVTQNVQLSSLKEQMADHEIRIRNIEQHHKHYSA